MIEIDLKRYSILLAKAYTELTTYTQKHLNSLKNISYLQCLSGIALITALAIGISDGLPFGESPLMVLAFVIMLLIVWLLLWLYLVVYCSLLDANNHAV